MQTYLVSILLRTVLYRVSLLVLLTLGMVYGTVEGKSISEPIESKDSLYAHWAKQKSTLPTLIYHLADFYDYSDRVEVESLIRTYGIGGIILSNGESSDVKDWIWSTKSSQQAPVIHAVAIDRIFELPFDGLPDYPSKNQVECLTNDTLVYELGYAHALTLKAIGIGLIKFNQIPDNYSQHEISKLSSYLQGLAAGHVKYYFANDHTQIQNYFYASAEQYELMEAGQIAMDGKLDKKSLKQFRKESERNWILIDEADEVDFSLKQIEKGVGMIEISKSRNAQQLINELLLTNTQKKACYKKNVREYFTYASSVNEHLNAKVDSSLLNSAITNQIEEAAITLVQDQYQLVPIDNLETRKITTISNDNTALTRLVDKYKTSSHYPITCLNLSSDSLLSLFSEEALLLADLTTISDESELAKRMTVLNELNRRRPVIVLAAGRLETMARHLGNMTVIWNPDDSNIDINRLVAIAFGALGVNGAMPGYVNADDERKGEVREAIGRLTYDLDVSFDIAYDQLNKIDSLVQKAIQQKMMPGCQVMMVKDGAVVYDKSFGYLTYDSLTEVSSDLIYDIASVTKTVATVPVLMKHMEHGGLSLTGHLGDYLTNYRTTDKSDLTIDDILTHRSGLKSYIPFWRNAKYDVDSTTFLYKQKIRRRKYDYLSVNWSDSIQSWIATSKYNSLGNSDGSYRYLYSDLGFMLMKEVVEENCSCPFDQSVDELIYRPMGMDHTSFNPLNKFSKAQIAPTERDRHFRSSLLQGEVHDKNAALLGGVSGHAGLFSNANDLAKYMQMMLQNGYYGGVRYFSDSIVNIFTSKVSRQDRRALGWDKPDRSVGNASRYASDASFGHSGFTGTLVWADPEYDLIYIFLSNRIYPDPQNYKLIESNVRTKIHDLMYESIINVDKRSNHGS